MISSPFKWVGGKRRLKKHIVSLLPQHSCYVEPFAGAAWVLFAKEPSDVEVLNDINGDLVNFFRVVKEQPEALIESFEMELVARKTFERLADMNPEAVEAMSPVDRAHRFYYLIMAGWGGEYLYPRFQTSVKDGGHGNRLIGALKTLRKRIEPVHRRLRTVIIEHLDWETCFERYDRKGVVMYLDPPYPKNKVNYAHNMRSWEDHEVLAKALASSKCDWILSSYDVREVRAMYRGFHVTPVEAFSGMNASKNGSTRVKNKEVLITSFTPSFVQSETLKVNEGEVQTLFDKR